MNTSIVIPALISKQPIFAMTKKLLDDIFYKTRGIAGAEVILVDDGSNVKYIDFLQKFNKDLIIVRNPKNVGFAMSVNAGIRKSSGDKILILNNDVIIKDGGWLNNMIRGMDTLGYDIAAPKQSILDETYEYIPDAKRKNYVEEKCFSYLVGWCLLVKRKVFKEAGMFPTNFGIGFWEDTAWSYVIRNNFSHFKSGVISGINNEQLQHLEHQTFKAENISVNQQYSKNREIFLQYIKGRVQLDLPLL